MASFQTSLSLQRRSGDNESRVECRLDLAAWEQLAANVAGNEPLLVAVALDSRASGYLRSTGKRRAICWAALEQKKDQEEAGGGELSENAVYWLDHSQLAESQRLPCRISLVEAVHLTSAVLLTQASTRDSDLQAQSAKVHEELDGHILRQKQSFQVKGAKFRVLSSEPTPQGILTASTVVTIIAGDGRDCEHEQDSRQDILIDESFLSTNLESDSEDEAEKLPEKGLQLELADSISEADSAHYHKQRPSWRIMDARSLKAPAPDYLYPNLTATKDDTLSYAFVSTRKLAESGIVSGDWALIRRHGRNRTARLVRVFAKASDGPVELSPTLLYNMLEGGPLEPLEISRIDSATLQSQVALPLTASRITLARISNPLTSNREHEELCTHALQRYFKGCPSGRVVKTGDLLAVPVETTLERWRDRLDTYSESQTDTDLIYYRVTSASVDASIIKDDSVVYSSRGIRMIPGTTQLLQIGSEQSLLPRGIFPFHSYFGIPPIQSSSKVVYPLSEHLEAALKCRNEGLNLDFSVMLKGAHANAKEAVVQSACQKTGFHSLTISCYDVLGESETKTEAALRIKLERAVECAPCVIHLVDIDALARNSQAVESGQEPKMAAILTSLLADFVQAQSAKPFPAIVVASTTDIDKLHNSVTSLFKTTFTVEAPGEAERLELLKVHVNGRSLGPDVSLDAVALQSAALLADDIADLVQQADIIAFERILGTVNPPVSVSHLEYYGYTIDQSDFVKALDIARSAYSESIGAPKIPNVTWDDVGGLATVKAEILDTLQLPLEHPELFADGLKKRSGILLYGPPGTGKTLLAKAVATSCSLNFLSVKGPELLNMYIGESEANVRRIFQKARDARPCCIFFDELDSVAPKRGNQGDSGGVMDRIVSQLLAELDSMSDGNRASDIFVIGATNRPDLLDSALLRPGRFDRLLYLGVSEDHEAQLNILLALTRKFRLDPATDLAALSRQCPFNFTGADFYALCSDAMLKAMSRKASEIDAIIDNINRQPPYSTGERLKMTPQYYLNEFAQKADIQVLVEQQDFEKALSELQPSVSPAEMQHYREVQIKFSAAPVAEKESKGKGKVNGVLH